MFDNEQTPALTDRIVCPHFSLHLN